MCCYQEASKLQWHARRCTCATTGSTQEQVHLCTDALSLQEDEALCGRSSRGTSSPIDAQTTGGPSRPGFLAIKHVAKEPASVRHPSSAIKPTVRTPSTRRGKAVAWCLRLMVDVRLLIINNHFGSPARAATPSSSTTTLSRPPVERQHPSSSMATSLASAARGARQCLEAHLLQHEVQVRGGTLHARTCACTTTS